MTDRPSFEAPWQARTFALAVALREAGHIPRSALPATRADPSDSDAATHEPGRAHEYYEICLAALEAFARSRH